MRPFSVTILYLDDNLEDVAVFRNLIKDNPQFSAFAVSVVHFTHLSRVIQWLKLNPVSNENALTCCCFDPSAKGIDPAASHLAVQRLVEAGLSRDSVIALPDPNETDVVWQVLRGSLQGEQVLSKADVLAGNDLSALAAVMSEALSKRTSGGTRTLEFAIMRLESELRVFQQEAKRDADALDRRISENVLGRFTEAQERLEKRLHTLEYTVFPAQDLTGNPSIVTLLQSLRQSVGALSKDSNRLDADIGRLAELTRSRQDKLGEEVKTLHDQVKGFGEKRTESHELRLRRVDFAYSTGGKIVLAIAAVFLGLIVVWLAPELLELLTLIFS